MKTYLYSVLWFLLHVFDEEVKYVEDAQIIELYFARRGRAITETDRKYGKLCLHIANHILSDGRDSAECVNDTYLCVWNKIPPTRPENFRAFLSKIVRNLSLKKLEFLHAKKRNANIELSFSELEEVVPDHRIRPDYIEEELGELLSAFLKKKKTYPVMCLFGSIIF